MADDRFLPALCQAVQVVHAEGADIQTQSFANLMDQTTRIFDYLGTVLHVAKHEMVTKTGSIRTAAASYPSLRQVVEADRAAGRATVKDSCARNLHRLGCTLKFLRVLLQQFLSSPTMTTREAANKAYEQSLGPLHIYVVRTAVWAGMYMLPTREAFMHQLGETNESAMQYAKVFVQCCQDVEAQVMRLFDGIKMPVSTPASNVIAALWSNSPMPDTASTARTGTAAMPAS